jgi:enoyl-CoA hydratase/carnithine racemase
MRVTLGTRALLQLARSRRIGRRRACYMAVSGAEIDVQTALAWGLVDAVEPAA